MRLSAPTADWLGTLRRYVAVSAGLNLVWEAAQLPLYTIWSAGTPKEQLIAIAHCTAGDVLIAALALLAALVLFGHPAWPMAHWRTVFLVTLASGVAYTLYSEWLNTVIRKSWAYSPSMPTLAWLGTGLAPLLQWIVVPTLALGIAARRRPWSRHQPQRRSTTMSQFRSFLGSPMGLVVCLGIAALGLYLLVHHLNHVLLAIPYLALLACPLMHFMHRGHHGHHLKPKSKIDNT